MMDSPISINGIPYLITHLESMNNPKSKNQAQKTKSSKQNKSTKQKSNNTLLIAPVNQQVQKRIGAPQYLSSTKGDGSIRVRHREFIRDIAGSIDFSCITLPINPGIAAVFEWLNTIANNYESYVAVKISFEFETMKSTATNGSLLMAVDYNGADPIPTSKAFLMSFNHAVRSPVWSECIYDCRISEMRKIGPDRYIRNAALAANLDIKTYDIGQLFVATQGCADTSVIGELYVNYDIILQTPQALTPPSPLLLNIFQAIRSVGSISRTNAFGNAPVYLGTSIVSVDINTITFLMRGNFLISIWTTGTGVGLITTSGTTTCLELQQIPILYDDGFFTNGSITASGTSLVTTGTTSNVVTFIVDAEVNETLILGFTTNYATLTALGLVIVNGPSTSL